MRARGLWLASAIVMASSLGALALVAVNRSGEPEAVLELTERELRLPAKEADSTALMLQLQFERRPPRVAGRPERMEAEDAGWFDRAKLDAIGFDCSRPVAPEHASFYKAQPPRWTFAALEYEGEEWRRDLERASDPDAVLDTHLAVIDVDNDPTALRSRHPDRRRVAIVQATAVLRYVAADGKPPFLTGRVVNLWPAVINVPREWRPALEAYQSVRSPDSEPPARREPRYRVTVKWGKRLEPWVAGVEPVAPAVSR